MFQITRIILLSLLLLSLANSWIVAWIIISPPKFEFNASPWQVIEDVIKITNTDSKPMVLRSEVQDFISWEAGQPIFVTNNKQYAGLSLANWVSVSSWSEVRINPGEKVQVPFIINVPETAEPWWHYWSIFFYEPQWNGQVAVIQKIWSLILIKVAWDVREEWEVTKFGLFDSWISSSQLIDAKPRFLSEYLPVNFSVLYQNKWNIHMKPNGKIEIFDLFWNKLKKIWVKTLIWPNNVEQWKEIVDYIPVNDGAWNVLALSSRKFDSMWKWYPYWQMSSPWVSEIQYSGFPIWVYTAKLTLVWAKWEVFKSQVKFMVFPYKVIFWGILWSIILVYCFIRYRRWSINKLRAQIKKELDDRK